MNKREERRNAQEYQEWCDAADLLSHRASFWESCISASPWISMSEEESIFGLRAACKASMVVMAVILTHPEWVQTNVSGEAEAIIRRELQIWGDLKESNKRSRK